MAVLKIERLPHNKNIPAYQTEGAAGMDLCAAIEAPVVLKPLERALVPTGLKIELEHGYEAQIRPRSGLSIKHGITLINCVGTIDEDYRGEVCVPVVNLSNETYSIQPQERMGGGGGARAGGGRARGLASGPGAEVVCIRKRVLADAEPVIYSVNYLPRALLGGQDERRADLTGSIFDVLENVCGQQVSSTVAHIKAACPDEAIRAAMQLDAGEAMLLLDEVCYTRLCRPVLRALSYYTNFFDFSILRKLL